MIHTRAAAQRRIPMGRVFKSRTNVVFKGRRVNGECVKFRDYWTSEVGANFPLLLKRKQKYRCPIYIYCLAATF